MTGSAETQSSYLEYLKNPTIKGDSGRATGWWQAHSQLQLWRTLPPKQVPRKSHILKMKINHLHKVKNKDLCSSHTLEATFSQISFSFLVNTYTLARTGLRARGRAHTESKHPSVWRKASGPNSRSHCFLLGNNLQVQSSSGNKKVSHNFIMNSTVYVPACLYIFSIS